MGLTEQLWLVIITSTIGVVAALVALIAPIVRANKTRKSHEALFEQNPRQRHRGETAHDGATNRAVGSGHTEAVVAPSDVTSQSVSVHAAYNHVVSAVHRTTVKSRKDQVHSMGVQTVDTEELVAASGGPVYRLDAQYGESRNGGGASKHEDSAVSKKLARMARSQVPPLRTRPTK